MKGSEDKDAAENPTVSSSIYSRFNNFKEYMLGQRKEDIQKFSTSKLIELLTHSAPDSNQEKMVIEAIEHRIEQNNKIPQELLEEVKKIEKIYKKFHNDEHLNEKENIALSQYREIDRKIKNKGQLDDNEVKISKAMKYRFYDLNEMVHEVSGPGNTPMGKNDSLITAAARYGHSKVVDLLVNKGGVDILSTRNTANYNEYGPEKISALSYLRQYQKKILPQRKIYKSEYLLMPVVLLANAAQAIGSAIASVIPGKKSTEIEKSSADIAQDLINAGEKAVRDRANSAPALLGGGQNNQIVQVDENTVIRSKAHSAPPVMTSTNIVESYQSFPRDARTNSKATVTGRSAKFRMF